MRVSPQVALASVHSKVVVLLLLIHCLLLLPFVCEGSVLVFFSILYVLLVLQSSLLEKGIFLLYLPGTLLLLIIFSTSLQCHGLVCGVFLRFFLSYLLTVKTQRHSEL